MGKYLLISFLVLFSAGSIITGCFSNKNPGITIQSDIQQQNASESVESSMPNQNWEQKFLNNFYSINIDNMDIRTEADLPDALNESGWCLKLAEISTAHISAYGYMDGHFGYRGVLIVKDGIIHYFPDIYFSSPELVLPKIKWDEKRQILIMSSHNMTGTALSADELIVFLVNGINKIEYFSFTQVDLEQQIEQQITYSYNEENQEVNISHRYGDLLGSEHVSGIEGKKITGLNVLNMITFIPGQDTIVKIQIGLNVEGWMSPYYSDSPLVLSAPVQIKIVENEGQKSVEFTMGELSLDSSGSD